MPIGVARINAKIKKQKKTINISKKMTMRLKVSKNRNDFMKTSFLFLLTFSTKYMLSKPESKLHCQVYIKSMFKFMTNANFSRLLDLEHIHTLKALVQVVSH